MRTHRLLHWTFPRATGYARWTASLKPILQKLKLDNGTIH